MTKPPYRPSRPGHRAPIHQRRTLERGETHGFASHPPHAQGPAPAPPAVAGAVALGAPLALASTAEAAPAPSTWDKIAQCESGGNWGTNTGNGYYGGLQFTRGTWRAYGGPGMPHTASKAQQIAVAQKVLAKQGWKAWPACSRKAGYRG